MKSHFLPCAGYNMGIGRMGRPKEPIMKVRTWEVQWDVSAAACGEWRVVARPKSSARAHNMARELRLHGFRVRVRLAR